jgi:hypothetical protein
MNPQPLPPSVDRVRVFVPSSASNNLEQMQKITASVLGKLGCPGCHSGRILDFVTLQEFVVNPATLEVQELSPAGMQQFGR